MNRINYNKLSYDIPMGKMEGNYENCYAESSSVLRKDIPFTGEEEIKYVRHESYAFVSSSHRNATSYPLHYDYKIKFTNPYKNVKCIEMLSATIPNTATILDEPVVVFDINEINHIDFKVDDTSSKIFTALPLGAPSKTTNGFITINNSARTRLVFKNPISTLSTLSIRILDVDGAVIDFGAPAGSTAKALQHSFVLKITTEEKTRETISYRNVF